MGHNPLATGLKAKAAELEELQERRTRLLADRNWHRSFDRAATARLVEEHDAKCAALEAEKAAVTRELTSAKEEADRLERQAKLGLNPAYWFSSKRHGAKAELAAHHRTVAELELRRKRLTGRFTSGRRALETGTRSLAKFDGFSPGEAEAEVASLDAEILLLQLQYDHLKVRKQALDRLLEEPVQVLTSLQAEGRQVERDRDALRARVVELERDIDCASRLDRDLSRAANSYERAKIHQECEERLGVGSPRAVMGDRRRKLTEVKRDIRAAERQLESLERNVAKARDRVAKVVDRGTRDIRALVVDGSNLCYQGGTFIGLAALRPLCGHLARTFDVTIVFDASIRHKLGGVSDRDLRNEFANTTVHVVATKTLADETILAAAEDPYVFVLSNDRFTEYRDKPTVRDGRLIRHEIINGRVLVHDLDIAVSFAAKDLS